MDSSTMASALSVVQSWNWMRGSGFHDLPKKRIDGSRVRMGPFSLPLYTEFLDGGKLSPDWIGRPVKTGYYKDVDDSEDEDEIARPLPQDVLTYVMGDDMLGHLIAFPQLYRTIEKRVRRAFKFIYHEEWLQPQPPPLPPGTKTSYDCPSFTPYKLLDELYSELIYNSDEAYFQRARRDERLKEKFKRQCAVAEKEKQNQS
jgi:hypothetical protein